MLLQGGKPLLAAGQVAAVEHAQLVVGQPQRAAQGRHRRRKPRRRALHQGAQDAGPGMVDLVVE